MSNIFDLFRQISSESSTHEPITHLLVGLGNPGAKYEYTRHNAGFLFLDALCQKKGARIDRAKFDALCGEVTLGGHRVLLMKPQTMMNLSGKAVSAAASFYHISPENILVVFDDISLPVGRMRVRRQGSHGGHNGIKSIISSLGSDAFPRIKLGVGEKPHPDYDLVNWVLSEFSGTERRILTPVFEKAGEGAELILSGNVEGAMQSCNAFVSSASEGNT